VNEDEPVFFDPRTGEPIVWFWRAKSGEIELFNLMGFHPETGEELQPVSRDAVEAFKLQVSARRQWEERRQRPPQRIDPETFPPFDRVSGEARVWYWRGEEGEYEFYDNQGFHPRTGEALKKFDREAIATWKRDSIQRQQQQLKREREQRERAEQQEHEQQESLARQQREAQAVLERQQREEERRQREAQAVLERQQREAQAGLMCDQAAGNPHDPQKPSGPPGVPYEELKEHATEALQLCSVAMEKFPAEPRYKYQYARALGFSEPDKAIEIYKQLTRQKYPAAFDNLGSLLVIRKSYKGAVSLFKEGTQLGDPDSMVSLASFVGSVYFPAENPPAVKFALLSRAAQLGHQGAQLAIEQQKNELQQQQQERASQQQQERIMLQLFGTILRGVGH
jgi:hypothetical protein